MNTRFNQIVVIGCGKAAKEILNIANDFKGKYNYELIFIEHEIAALSNMQNICMTKEIQYEQLTDRSILSQHLLAIHTPTLIISAGNYYIFPKSVIEQQNIEIINFHNALLPKIPGRNATTWALYLNEKVSGATWHYVVPNIDAGAIIAQKEVAITEDMRAWELSKEITDAAIELFSGFFMQLLQKHITGTVQHADKTRKIYYSHEIPENGICSINMPPENIYRLLRSMDYGKNNVFPPARIILSDGSAATIKNYFKAPKEHCLDTSCIMDDNKQFLYIALSDKYELRITLKNDKVHN